MDDLDPIGKILLGITGTYISVVLLAIVICTLFDGNGYVQCCYE